VLIEDKASGTQLIQELIAEDCHAVARYQPSESCSLRPAMKPSRRSETAPSCRPFSTTLRREELCKLRVRDCRHTRRAVPHLRVSGKGREDAISAAASRHQRTDP
jgi:hypothetical protein